MRICGFYRCNPFGQLRAGSEPFAALEYKLREGSPLKKQKPRFFTSLRSVQSDKMDFSYIFQAILALKNILLRADKIISLFA